MQLPDQNTLISLDEIVRIVKSPSPGAYKKRFMKPEDTHPRPIQERPMLFVRAEWAEWFKANFSHA